MDALKRAEKARQAEASSDGAELDPASTQGFTLDPIDEPFPGERVPREPILDEPLSSGDTGQIEESPPSGAELEGLEGLELEDTRAMHGRLGSEPRREPGVIPDPEDTGDHTRSAADESPLLTGGGPGSEDMVVEDTSATLPSLKHARESVDRYFDGTSSNSITVDDLHVAMSQEATAEHQRVSGDTDTQRRVRAVFHAKEASRAHRGRNWVTVAVVPLLLIGAVGAAVFFLWQPISELLFAKPQMVQARSQPPAPGASTDVVVAPPAPAAQTSIPPPSVDNAGAAASGVPQSAVTGAETGTLTARDPGTTSPAPMPPTDTGSSAGVAGGAPAPASGTAALPGAVAEGDGSGTAELMAQAPSVAEVTGQAPSPSAGNGTGVRQPAPRSASDKVALAIRQSSPARSPAIEGGAFRIRRRSEPDRLHPGLTRAYAAWLAGDDVTAKREYELVLKRAPRNRNALQGLAAVAMRQGRWDAASRYYLELLRLNPRDSVAQAGIIAIHENVDPLQGESRIKLLLRAEPLGAHLHFTLGNLYAEQSRWGEAQVAYFNAHRLQSDNADYAYNLAVSLDQLGKRSNALEYYRLALDLAEKSKAVFDPVAAQARIYSVIDESN
jgi:cytochrome c-type biogenesis protein CcmH/NrfG